MNNKKGFTLVELLAVIVVLAVIAIIAIPIITNVIDKAKQGALKDSAYGILDSAEMYLAKNMNKGIDDTMEFTCNNGKCLSGTEEINYKGKIESGKVRIYTDSKIELCVTDNKSSALKTIANKKVEVTTGTCDYGELNYGVTALVSKEALDAKQNELDEMTTKYNNLKALADQTDITAEDIMSGKKALVNGEVITGTYTEKTITNGYKLLAVVGTPHYSGVSTTYTVTDPNYKSYVASDFLVLSNGYIQYQDASHLVYGGSNMSVSGYNSSNGVLTFIYGCYGTNSQYGKLNDAYIFVKIK